MASNSEQKLSRIEQWRKKKAEEKKAKNKVYYENKKQIIKESAENRDLRKSWKVARQRKSQLVTKGAMRTTEDEKEVETLRAVAQDLNEGLNAIKSDKSNSGRAAYTAAKSLAFGDNVKKKRSTKTVSKLFSLGRHSISKSMEKRIKILKGEESCWLAEKRQTR